MYVNKQTKEYPLYEGDIKLLYPSWNSELTLPEEFEEIEILEEPVAQNPNEIVYSEIKEIDGKYKLVWNSKILSEEEIEYRINLENKILPKQTYD